MHAMILPKFSCTHISRCSSARSPAAAPVAAATAAAVTRQQHTAVLALSATQRRQIIARVRIDDLERPAGSPQAAAEALQAYMQLEQNGELNSVTAGNLRLKYGIRRADSGRVELRRADGNWMQVKLDMEMRGTILLRNTADDTVAVLQTERLEQVDLSDDYVLFMLFADGSWEEQIIPIQLADESGVPSTLEMGEQQFKDYVGLIKTLQEAEQEAQAAVGSQQGRMQQGMVEDGDEDGAIDVTAEVAPSNGNKL